MEKGINTVSLINHSIVDQKHWDNGYTHEQLERIDDNHIIKKLIMKYIPHGNGSCIEIGGYPCRFLGIFGELGYKLSAIDTTEKIESNELKNWIKQNNWEYETLKQISFLDFKRIKNLI